MSDKKKISMAEQLNFDLLLMQKKMAFCPFL